jgi:hypothetical protein
MLLMPRKVKHRKVQRGGWSGKPATSGTSVSFGSYGLKAMEEGTHQRSSDRVGTACYDTFYPAWRKGMDQSIS